MQPITIIDSGTGGLSAYKSIRKLLPVEDVVYIADKKFFPYGTKSTKQLQKRGEELIGFCKKSDSKIVVLACNTLTVSALEYLRKAYPYIPIIGTVPVIKTCVQKTKNGKIGVMCTPKTANSKYQKDLINRFASGKQVYVAECPDLVEVIEKGTVGQNKEALNKPIRQLLEKDIDTIALGCTHFPLIAEQIKEVAGNNVAVLDSADAVARQVKRVLLADKALSKNKKEGVSHFYTTANSKDFDIMINKYLKVKTKSKVLEI